MSSARKIKARRKGHAQAMQADARRASGRTTRKQQQAYREENKTVWAPGRNRNSSSAACLAVDVLLDVLDEVRYAEPVLKEVRLSPWSVARLVAAQGTIPAQGRDMGAVASRFMGVPIREDRSVPEGGAVGVFSDGRTQYFPPDA